MELPVGDTYTIQFGEIGPDHFAWLASRDYAGWVVVTDTNTHRYCLPHIAPYLVDRPVVHVTVPEGERNKHLGTCQSIWEEMFRGGVGRRWCCLCLGGGVVGDMAGFAAGTFKRGIDFVQLPTTVLSQVDSSVGGKLGIDFFEVKNSIGLFRDPIAVWIDPRMLSTLPDRELRSGYAEIVKHALIADRGQWDALRSTADWRSLDWVTTIAGSVRIKRDIVLEDPFEHGRRKALNFGHTVGHAVESYYLETEQRLLHGEAIAHGMIAESYLSHAAGLLPEEELREITAYLIGVYGHRIVPVAAFPRLFALMRQDKKNEGEEINFTLLEAAGRAVVNKTATVGVIERSLVYYNSFG